MFGSDPARAPPGVLQALGSQSGRISDDRTRNNVRGYRVRTLICPARIEGCSVVALLTSDRHYRNGPVPLQLGEGRFDA
jgi:hypothetical protein